ncbi:MAG: hypothetical protein V3W34_10165 [Phycisphaerae bacterium]
MNRIRRLGCLALCLVLAGCDFFFIPRTQTVDLSQFTRFTLLQSGALGFCPVEGAVFSADIVVDASGQLVFNASVLAEGVAGVDQCVADTDLSAPCRVETPLPQRILSEDEVQSVMDVFSSVQLSAQDPLCAATIFEPCLVRRFAWGSFSVSDLSCADPQLSSEPILDLLEQLRAGSEVPPE